MTIENKVTALSPQLPYCFIKDKTSWQIWLKIVRMTKRDFHVSKYNAMIFNFLQTALRCNGVEHFRSPHCGQLTFLLGLSVQFHCVGRWLWRGILNDLFVQNYLDQSLLAHSMSVFALILKNTIIRLSCVDGKWKLIFLFTCSRAHFQWLRRMFWLRLKHVQRKFLQQE